ncbi:MAG: tRNA 2-thiouridine(34) synthase MnmA [Planctomycetota bacterium]|nr:tRNA 2-thiouridine(34) synthase MnmA [Planctomycetota bacterium]MDW8373739.1 tRNA 2-thiouridine(34) synthase MnmA [Planctomycetota bacterium]
MPRVLVGMSGGVDSSVAAALAVEAGDAAIGVTLKLWPCAEVDGGFTRADACCSPRETRDARAVAQRLGIPHYVIDAEDEFRAGVVDTTLSELAAGRTPNPCVRCNERVKFGSLWQHARALGAERIVTGHYARIACRDGRLLPQRALDRRKDQSYFLATLSQEQLARACFPLGGLSKEQVRDLARARGLPTADKHESQDLCFVGDDGLAGLLARERPELLAPGPIRDDSGRQLGTHRGIGRYTVGQRHGLGLASTEPLVVLAVDAAERCLIVGPRSRSFIRELLVRDAVWHLAAPASALRVLARTRYRGQPQPASVHADGRVVFDEATARPAPGQLCAFYDLDDELCLGAGWIVDLAASSRTVR